MNDKIKEIIYVIKQYDITIKNIYTLNTVDGTAIVVNLSNGYNVYYYMDVDKYSVNKGWDKPIADMVDIIVLKNLLRGLI